MDACYEEGRTEAINRGELAEVWLIQHRIADIQWSGYEYQVRVEAASEGLQFVQFERLEAGAELPVVVIEVNGEEVSVASGDW
jgi:hypothetical protein